MSKDTNLLKQVSIYFNEETLKDIIAKEKYTDKEIVEILSWNFKELSGKGDNYLSVVNRLSIKSKINGSTVETSVIVKSLPKNVFTRKLLRSAEYFYNEIMFYTEIASRFHKYLAAKGQTELLSIPRCLAYHLDGENDFIALQDVSSLGYKQVPRDQILPYEECKNILEVIARFHAISFAYKNEKKEDFKKMISFVKETFYRMDAYETSLKRLHEDMFNIAKDALAREYPGNKGEEVFNSHKLDELFKKTVEICSRKDVDTSVISHGDTWAPNFMKRNSISNKLDFIILDFQMARTVSPVLDVSFFIYQCTDKSLRENYFDKLLVDYYSELSKTMKILGSDPDKQYPREVFQNEIKEQSLYGLMFALINIPISLIPDNKVFDFDSMKEEVADIGDLNQFSNLERSEDRQRLADIILHAVEKEFIQ